MFDGGHPDQSTIGRGLSDQGRVVRLNRAF